MNAKRFTTYLTILIFACMSFAQNANLRFEENKGQWRKEILYKTDFTQGKLFVLKDKVSIVVQDSNNRYFHPHVDNPSANQKEKYSIFSIQPYKATFSEIVTGKPLNGYTNYIRGNDKDKWQSNVHSYQAVIYKNIYPYTDWEISSSLKMPKHSYIVHPKGDYHNISTLYKGVRNVEVIGNKLYITTPDGNISEDELFVYQTVDNRIVQIKAEYSLKKTDDAFLVSYIIGDYDKEKDLIIDPALIFCTYSGAHSDNWGMTSCYDKKGLLISGGIVYGGEYPLSEGAYDSTYSDNWDCVITKYDSLGQNIIFSTFLGGNYCEIPHSMIVNNNDELVIFGTTGSVDFPITDNAFQKEFNGGRNIEYERSLVYPFGIDIFVCMLNSKGTDLLASTYIGGSDNDGFNYRDYYGANTETLYNGNDSLYANFGDCARGEIITDQNNNVYVASCTFSQDFPTTDNAYQTTACGRQDAVVFKLDRSLSSMIFSTYLGGINDDAAYSIDIDPAGRSFVCGGTVSMKFPTTANAYNKNFNGGSTDAFLSILSADGSLLEYSTFFGSPQYDQAFFVRLDKQNNPYIFGQTKAQGSTLIKNATYAIPNSGQFVAKFSPTLDVLHFSTVFGSGDGMINISPSGFAIDACNRIYCAGWGRIFKYMKDTYGYASHSTENLETTPDAYMDFTDGMDFYIMTLTENASDLDYATFFGEYDDNIYYANDHVDGGTSRFDRYGNFYLTICASCSGSQGMPTTSNAFSSTNNSTNCNIASVKFTVHNDFAVSDFTFNSVNCVNNAVLFTNYSRGDSFLWNFGDDSAVSEQKSPEHTYEKGGEYEITLITSMSEGCIASDTLKKKILILDNKARYLDTLSVCKNRPINIGIENLEIYEQQNISIEWTPKEYLSDPNIINPYATITEPTLFKLIITTDNCKDTLFRFVNIDTMISEIPDTLEYCSVPYVYEIENTLNRSLQCAWDKNFEQIVPMLNDSQYTDAVMLDDFGDKYLYIRYSVDGCSDIDSVYLKFTGIKCNVVTEHAGCNGESNGSAKVVTDNNNGKLHYKWSFSNEDSEFAEDIPAGTYSVKVFSDDDTCNTVITFSILAIADITLDFEVKNADCNNICNGQISLNVSGGDAPYEYIWSNGAVSSDISHLCAGDYTVTVTDNNGCSAIKTISVNTSYNINTELYATQNHCDNGCSAVITSHVTNGKEPYGYLWNNGFETESLTDRCNGDYILIVKDANGCSDTARITVTSDNSIEDFSATVDKEKVYDGAKIHLSSTYKEGFYYFWTPSTYLTTPENYETDGIIYETTIYNVYITDRKGCNNDASVKVEVEYVLCDEQNIFVPNVFSPNNDGKNDILYVSGDYIASMEWIIYNRWGEKVFQSDNINNGWDGKFRNEDCPAGVYYYKLEINCYGGKNYVTGGDVTLIR
ncbi:MAG: gliding motility-associated C-terminal domain-containing protein [Bacteroidales bacterium]|nr:gliding motility-associated C-terminal domain-containing protein [Bacteroidales bacterium]